MFSEFPDDLARALEEEIEWLAWRNIASDQWPRVAQTKRKFNALRFYLQGDCSQALDELIRMVENNCW